MLCPAYRSNLIRLRSITTKDFQRANSKLQKVSLCFNPRTRLVLKYPRVCACHFWPPTQQLCAQVHHSPESPRGYEADARLAFLCIAQRPKGGTCVESSSLAADSVASFQLQVECDFNRILIRPSHSSCLSFSPSYLLTFPTTLPRCIAFLLVKLSLGFDPV